MPRYHAPVTDWQFLLHDVLAIERHASLPGFADLTPDLTGAVLEAAARFHVDRILPLNAAGDAQGARLIDGQVRTPDGFREAWAAYAEAGWHRIGLDSNLGGGGLPPVMGVPIGELRVATGHAFSMYSSFCAPTARMLARLGEPWMQAHIVPALAQGRWTATMCMTEPQAGTDLRQLRTRAVPQPDGTWRLHGDKIFISGGDHDLTDNIVHVVLAKVVGPDGRVPEGLGAVGVFVVPKRTIDPATGASGPANGVEVRAIEHKMGIEGSATCALHFDGAVGWRIVDALRQGSAAAMAPMFLLMNYARVGTATSGIAYAELAAQNAADYARERMSGRATGRAPSPDRVADPIVAHADIRRLLLQARAFAEGARAAALHAALLQSVAEHGPDAAERERAGDVLDVLVPVMKAFFTDQGFDATVACQQVLGGHGYVRDHGLEQWVRNARIGQLYEGANGIQAIDLLTRKFTAHGGRARRAWLGAVGDAVHRHEGRADLADLVKPLRGALDRLVAALAWLDAHAADHPAQADAGAYDLLTAVGIVTLGWMWLEVAGRVTAPSPCRFLDAEGCTRKRQLARVWAQRQLTQVDALCQRIETGNDSLLALPDAAV